MIVTNLFKEFAAEPNLLIENRWCCHGAPYSAAALKQLCLGNGTYGKSVSKWMGGVQSRGRAGR